jgi:hypothetical protein
VLGEATSQRERQALEHDRDTAADDHAAQQGDPRGIRGAGATLEQQRGEPGSGGGPDREPAEPEAGDEQAAAVPDRHQHERQRHDCPIDGGHLPD